MIKHSTGGEAGVSPLGISHVWVGSPSLPQSHPITNTVSVLPITSSWLHSCDPREPAPNSIVQSYPSWLDTNGCSLPVHAMGGHAGQRALYNPSLRVHGPRAHTDTVSPGLSEPSLLGSHIFCQLPRTQQLLLPGTDTVCSLTCAHKSP